MGVYNVGVCAFVRLYVHALWVGGWADKEPMDRVFQTLRKRTYQKYVRHIEIAIGAYCMVHLYRLVYFCYIDKEQDVPSLRIKKKKKKKT